MKEPLRLTIHTHDPTKYILLNTEDGTRWRGTSKGSWERIPDVEYCQECGGQIRGWHQEHKHDCPNLPL